MHDTRFNSLAELTKQLLRGGPLEIPGGGGGAENSQKKIRAKKNAWKKNSCSHYVREKKFVQANSKVQIPFYIPPSRDF
jgi:hypothetical protein